MSIAPTTRGRGACDGRRCGLGGPFGRFHRDESGSLVIFSLMLLIAMIFTAGLAIDFMRYESTRSQLQNTMDRAVLAAASLKQTQDPEKVVRDYFERAGLGDYIGAVNVQQDLSSGSASYRRVKAVAGATMDPIFLPIMGKVAAPRGWVGEEPRFDKMPVLAVSSAEEGISDVEISLVLDVSGSMGWNSASGKSKIHELREAAKDFVYNMQCNPNASRASGEACEVEHGKVSISIVPYSEQVSAGPLLLGQYSVTNEHNASFCVDFDSDDFQTTELSAIDLLERTGHFDPWNASNRAASNWTCRNENWRWIKPFMDDYTEAMAAIDALSAGGNTSIDLGMKWGTALVDPGTQDVITSLASTPIAEGSSKTLIDPVFVGRPYDYGQSYNMKVIVLMTDGVNTNQHYLKPQYRSGPSEVWHYTKADGTPGAPVYSVLNPDTGAYRWVKPDGTDFKTGWQTNVYIGEPQETCGYETQTYYTWWGALRTRNVWVCNTTDPDGTPYQLTYPEVWAKFTTKWFDLWRPNPVSAHGNATKNDRLSDICKAAKDKDILVYSIGFEVGSDSTQEAILSGCATTKNHFFRATGMNISQVFGAIASSINQLRLTE